MKHSFPLMLLMAVLALIFVPIPMLGIEILLGANFLLSVLLFVTSALLAEKCRLYIAQAALCFCAIAIGVAIATTRTFLTTKDFMQQLFLARTIGQWICRENAVLGIMSTFGASAAVIIFCREVPYKVAETAGRFCLDMMGTKSFAIDQELNQGRITQEEARTKREILKQEAEGYSALDGTTKCLGGTINAFVWIFAASILGNFGVGVLECDLFWKDAFRQSAILSCGYLALQIPPLLFTSAALFLQCRNTKL